MFSPLQLNSDNEFAMPIQQLHLPFYSWHFLLYSCANTHIKLKKKKNQITHPFATKKTWPCRGANSILLLLQYILWTNHLHLEKMLKLDEMAKNTSTTSQKCKIYCPESSESIWFTINFIRKSVPWKINIPKQVFVHPWNDMKCLKISLIWERKKTCKQTMYVNVTLIANGIRKKNIFLD
jgi:hypothetical protein